MFFQRVQARRPRHFDCAPAAFTVALTVVLNSPRRHFLGWDEPLLPQAVRFLAGGWRGGEPLDLSRTLVLTPTRQSGRRLRHALAHFAAEHGSAVFPPATFTPEGLVSAVEAAAAPGRLESVLAWTDVLRHADLDEFRAVFPVDPPDQGFGWAFRLGERLFRLQTVLREGGLSMADVPAKAGDAFPEQERWQQLAALAERQRARLETGGWAQPPAAAALPVPSLERIVLIAVADPMPQALRLIAGLPRVGIDVVVFAPDAEAAMFDGWGRPISTAWSQREIDLPAFEARTHVCADPADQGRRIAALLERYDAAGAPERVGRSLAIGVGDPEAAQAIERAAGGAQRVYLPEGRLRRAGALYALLAALARVAQNPDYDAIEALARCPDFLGYLAARGGAGFSAATFLAALDELRREHLPAELAAAQRHADGVAKFGLGVIAEFRAELLARPFAEGVAAVLAELYGPRELSGRRPSDTELSDDAAAWTDLLRSCARLHVAFPALAQADWWELALRVFGEARRASEKPAGAWELQGWLELLFEDAPHLAIAGLNDGFVPEAATDDPFLPDSLRARLGLRTNADRLARDSYLLQALAASRAQRGRLDVLLGKASMAGDPLRPSRLLFRCGAEQLADRVERLFAPVGAPESHQAWTRAWRLRPRVVPPPAQAAVTALRRWLACPFRFYLKQALRMEAVEPGKVELDAFDFGTLCHAALEAMGRDSNAQDCSDPDRLRDFLLAELNRAAKARYGADISLPLLIQLESARQRLGKLAEAQARERAEGWRIIAVERPFEVQLSGLLIRGKIDRIDQHERTGAVRVIDYKTSDTAVNPRAAHFRAPRDGESLPEWAVWEGDGRRRVWADLQLPLYRHKLSGEFGTDIACGYFNLPKAVSQTGLALWDDYSLELQASAVGCAEQVCAAIRRGEFWPPSEAVDPQGDEFAALFHETAADSVAWPGAREEER